MGNAPGGMRAAKGRKEDAMKAVAAALSLVVLSVLAVIINGLAITALWEWFIARPFGVMRLTIPHAFGLALIVNWMVKPHIKKGEDEHLIKGLAQVFVAPLFALAFGWLIQCFM
jgi:hypothetical protein